MELKKCNASSANDDIFFKKSFQFDVVRHSAYSMFVKLSNKNGLKHITMM